MNLARPGLECGRGIVEGGGAGTEHRHHLAAQRREVDGVRSVRAQMPGQARQEVGHPPAAHPLLAGGENDLAGTDRSGRGRNGEAGQAVVGAVRHDLARLDAIADGDAGHPPEPHQVGGPLLLRDVAHGGEVLRPPLRLVPRLVGERRHLEIRPRLVLPAPQRVHPRVGQPRAFQPLLGAVDAEDVRHLVAQQREGDGERALAGADQQHVQHRLTATILPLEPGRARMRDQVEIMGDVALEFGKRSWCGHAAPPAPDKASRTGPIGNRLPTLPMRWAVAHRPSIE
nr:hypothetical protein [Elioraea thermophila]